jgi:hypothetical protein
MSRYGEAAAMARLEVVERILVQHQRRDIASCICGWAELGKSHPAHQAAMLRDAGLLVSRAQISKQAALAERERELLELKGPCSSGQPCRLHYAHSGACAPVASGD